MPRLAAACVGIVFTILTGCTPSPPTQEKVPCHPASGSLFIGGKPAKGATIIFVPKNEPAGSKIPRPRGTVGDDGSFQVTTFDPADGAPPGEYGLTVIWPGNDQDDQLNGRYSLPDKAGKTLKVVEGKNDFGAIKLK